MGKTTTNTKPATPARRAAKTGTVAEKATVSQPEPAKPKAARPKAAATKTKAAVPRARKPKYSQDDVALRAYFIAERRQAAGRPGDAHQDWIEAERQIASEASAPGKAKPKRS